jgi:hypothetical protein
VVAALNPIAFIPDHTARTEDLIRFFNTNTIDSERTDIQKKYRVNYLLINKLTHPDWEQMSKRYSEQSVGEKLFGNSQFELILLKESMK